MPVGVEVIREVVKDKPILFCKKCGVKTEGLSKNKILCDKCFKKVKELVLNENC